MRRLKQLISFGLLAAAAAIALATAFSDHSNDYGQVSVPGSGTVHLPKGQVTIFYRQDGENTDPRDGNGGLAFQVTPADGGEPIAVTLENGDSSGVAVTRSETIGELGSIAKLKVPNAGDYVVRASSGLPPGTSDLEFGESTGEAMTDRWKLLAVLVGAALLLALIPVPRRRWGESADDPTWSSDPRAPYAG
jgi:hypothetical protein